MQKKIFLIWICLMTIGVSHIVHKKYYQQSIVVPIVDKPTEIQPIRKTPIANITTEIPNYLDYKETNEQLQTWNNEAPDLTEIGIIGKSSKNKEIKYIKLTNEFMPETNEWKKPKVLITACIHGNEPLASSVVMGYIGSLLKKYGKEDIITNLLDNREIYFVPILSPDSYPNSRHVDGVDPNRDFGNLKSAPVTAIQEFVKKYKFNAIISGHTWGRVILFPPGNSMKNSPNHDDFKKIISSMSNLSGYRNMRACDLYQSNGGLDVPPIRYGDENWEEHPHNYVPIYGTEIDWYYSQSAFPIVIEFGTHQRIPSSQDIKEEFNQTFEAFLFFCKEAPFIKLNPNH